MKLDELVGRQLMIGMSGERVTPETIELFRDTHAGGLILFRPNFYTAEALRDMISELEEILERRLLVAVDHEGGRVIHLAGGVTVFPDNLVVGHTGKEEWAYEQGAIEARELRRLGIDVNLAPTLDVLTETFSPNIGVRSYGKDPNVVARLGSARIRGMQENGLSACAKHFPGQGHSPVDSHLGLPVLEGTWERMRPVHIKPFEAAIKAGVDTIMTSHPVYSGLDPARVPATFSKKVIGFLRKDLRFDGVVFSDDLEMGALRNISPIGESAVRAVEAGHDIVLVCHDHDAQRETFRALLQAYQSGRIQLDQLEHSMGRIEKLGAKRRERFLPGTPAALPGGNSLAEKMVQKGIAASKNYHGRLAGQKEAYVIFPKVSALGKRIFIEDVFQNESGFVQAAFREFGVNAEVDVVDLEVSQDALESIEKSMSLRKAVVFFCFDAHLDAGTRRLLEMVQASANACAVILLRDPYDVSFLREGAAYAAAFGFRRCQIRRAIQMLFDSK